MNSSEVKTIWTTNLELDKQVIESITSSREGHVVSFKDPATSKVMALKFFTWHAPEVIGLKKEIITSLIEEKSGIDIPELILPETLYEIENFKSVLIKHLYSSNSRTIGFSMDLCEGAKTLETVLRDDAVPREKKIDYLKRVGRVLERLKELRKSGLNLYLNDLHESNILIDREGTLRIIDVDSCKLKDLPSLTSKYLNPRILSFYKEKYRYTPRCYPFNSIEVDENTDLYCYVIMIINYLINFGESNLILPLNFKRVLTYLSDNGVPLELIKIFARIYSEEDNVNPYEMLDLLIPYLENTKGKRISFNQLF